MRLIRPLVLVMVLLAASCADDARTSDEGRSIWRGTAVFERQA